MLKRIQEMVRALVLVRSQVGSRKDDSYWTSRENSLELIKLSRIIKLV